MWPRAALLHLPMRYTVTELFANPVVASAVSVWTRGRGVEAGSPPDNSTLFVAGVCTMPAGVSRSLQCPTTVVGALQSNTGPISDYKGRPGHTIAERPVGGQHLDGVWANAGEAHLGNTEAVDSSRCASQYLGSRTTRQPSSADFAAPVLVG